MSRSFPAPGRLARAVPALAACALALAGCEGAGAPTDREVCWRAIPARGGQPVFTVFARGVTSLDDCAAELEALHLQGAPRADGAFQGYFIFIDAREVASSTGLKGFHYPIFQPAQRREIDADLRGLIKERNGALPTASDLAVERR
ncbi:MAG: hypothetical protein ABI306_09920 [Caulobacteraceae bacterium]